jgi:NADH-quinone oxidoreductase subunit L
MTHAFFKALLFLGAGSVIHGLHDEQDLRRMGGLKKYMPITFATMFTAWLAISGIPIFAGFFSKDEILWRTWSTSALPDTWGHVLWGIAALTALLTAIYMTRLMVMTFWGEERFGQDTHAHSHGHNAHAHKPHESPMVMWLPLALLAVLSIFGGLVGVPPALSSWVGLHTENHFEHFLEPAVARTTPVAQIGSGPFTPSTTEAHGAATGEAAHDVSGERLFTVISIIVAGIGLGIGWMVFKKRPVRKMPRLLENKYYVDEIYDAAIITPLEEGSRHLLWKVVDVKLIDGFVNGVAGLFASLGNILRATQTGLARSYAAVILLGAIVVIGYFALR